MVNLFIDAGPDDVSSYSLVNQAQRAALWKLGVNICLAASVQMNVGPDSVCYRIRHPLDFTGDERTFVFATAETHWLPKHRISRGRIGDVQIVTPSEFSRKGLIRAGAKEVFVVPHGVDHIVYGGHLQHTKGEVYKFLNVSSMFSTKGIDLLLRAFAVVVQRHHHARLILKGCDQAYPSFQWLKHTMLNLKQEERQAIDGKVRYIGETMHVRALSALYRSADCYVSPYRAEAFNLPVLEALACGLPVICTQGGPTDDFLGYGLIHFVHSEVIARGVEPEEMILEPDLDDLTAKMLAMIDIAPHQEVSQLGNRKLPQDDFSWDRAARQLMELFSR